MPDLEHIRRVMLLAHTDAWQSPILMATRESVARMKHKFAPTEGFAQDCVQCCAGPADHEEIVACYICQQTKQPETECVAICDGCTRPFCEDHGRKFYPARESEVALCENCANDGDDNAKTLGLER